MYDEWCVLYNVYGFFMPVPCHFMNRCQNGQNWNNLFFLSLRYITVFANENLCSMCRELFKCRDEMCCLYFGFFFFTIFPAINSKDEIFFKLFYDCFQIIYQLVLSYCAHIFKLFSHCVQINFPLILNSFPIGFKNLVRCPISSKFVCDCFELFCNCFRFSE